MRAIPGPTDAWAEIVGHLAWPVTLLILVFAFRTEVGRAAGSLAKRFGSGDIKLGAFSLSGPEDSVKPLVAGSVPASEVGDDAVTERLFETMAVGNGLERLTEWVRAFAPEAASLEVFLNDPNYATLRLRALRALEGDGDA